MAGVGMEKDSLYLKRDEGQAKYIFRPSCYPTIILLLLDLSRRQIFLNKTLRPVI